MVAAAFAQNLLIRDSHSISIEESCFCRDLQGLGFKGRLMKAGISEVMEVLVHTHLDKVVLLTMFIMT